MRQKKIQDENVLFHKRHSLMEEKLLDIVPVESYLHQYNRSKP